MHECSGAVLVLEPVGFAERSSTWPRAASRAGAAILTSRLSSSPVYWSRGVPMSLAVGNAPVR